MPLSISPCAATAFVAALLLGPLAGSASAGVVTVSGAEGAPAPVDLGTLAGREDVTGRSYVVRRADGAGRRTVTGYSLALVLEAAGVDPVHVGYVEVARAGGAPLLLSRRQATTAGDEPVVVYEDGDGVHVLRPSSGDGDLNGADEVVAADGRVAVLVRSGKLLSVSIEASDDRVSPRELVSFEAVLGREAAGESLTISWYFDDGTSAKGRTVRHRFARRGSYDVTVGVTAPGDAAGASAVKTVQVGEPVSRGPDRKGGGTNTAPDAPDSGAADGGSGAPGAGAASSGSPDASPGSDAAAAAAARRRAAERRRQVARRRAAERRTRERRPTPPRPAGDVVRGELISSRQEAEVVAPPPPATAVAARTGREQDGDGFNLPAAVWQIGALAVLMALGWAGDMRRAPRAS